MSDTSIYNALYGEISPYKARESDLMRNIPLCIYTPYRAVSGCCTAFYRSPISRVFQFRTHPAHSRGGRILHPLRLRVHTLMFLTLCVHRVFEATIDGNGHGSINTIPRHSGDSETLFAYYNTGCPFAYTLYHVRSITFCY